MELDPVVLSKELMKFQSVTPEDDGAINFVGQHLQDLGFSCTFLEFGKVEKIKNLYARLGDKSPNLCFAGHTDVVPPGDLNKWKFPPFASQVSDGVLYGRGAVDMKTGICAFISAVSRIIFKVKFEGSISFIITGNEERSNMYGTKSVIEWITAQNQKIDYCIVGEPSSNSELGDVIKIGSRGKLTFNLKCYGTQGHTAYPHLADNPINNMVDIIHKINNTKLDTGNKFFEPSGCVVTTIDVNNPAFNVIPDLIVANLNIRYNTEHTSESLFNLIDSICSSVTEKYTLDNKNQTTYDKPYLIHPDKQAQMMVSAIQKHTGKTPKFATNGGISDGRYIKDYCPVIEFGLLCGKAHHINENTPVSYIYTLSDIYLEFIKTFFNIN